MSTTTTTSPASTVPAVTTPAPAPAPPSSTTTTTSTTPTITSTTSSSTTTTSSSSSTTTTNTSTSNPSTPTSTGNGSGTSALSTNGSSSATSTLQVPVTSVGESTTTGTSDGLVYTQTSFVTTVVTPGVTAPANRASGGSRVNIGAIVGGAVGGVAALVILTVLIVFCLRKRRKDEFDGNFDPVHVNSGKGGLGGTLPNIDLEEEGHIMNDGRVRGADEDDGMGGRLGSGVGGGGIIMPYTFKPPTPVGGGGVGGQQYQSQELPQMQQMANLGVAAGGVGASMYGNEKRSMRQHSQAPNSYATSSPPHSHMASPSIHSNPNYPPSPYLNPTPEPYTPGATSDGSSSVGGGVYYPQQQQHLQAMGAIAASRGPSVLSSSSGNSGGRNAKEMEAMGRVVTNPDGQQGQYGPQQGPPQQQHGQFQAYLQNGPGPYQQQQQQQPQQQPQQQYNHHPSSSQSSQQIRQDQTSSSSPRAGTAVVVHEDGGRVILRKGAEEGEGEALSPEIPPTYDSLPVDVRRDG